MTWCTAFDVGEGRPASDVCESEWCHVRGAGLTGRTRSLQGRGCRLRRLKSVQDKDSDSAGRGLRQCRTASRSRVGRRGAGERSGNETTRSARESNSNRDDASRRRNETTRTHHETARNETTTHDTRRDRTGPSRSDPGEPPRRSRARRASSTLRPAATRLSPGPGGRMTAADRGLERLCAPREAIVAKRSWWPSPGRHPRRRRQGSARQTRRALEAHG